MKTSPFRFDAKKKGQLTKQLKEVQKNNQCLRRVMEGLFYLTPDQKEGDYFIWQKIERFNTHPTFVFS